MDRRTFLSMSGAAGVAAMTASTAAIADDTSGRQYYELRKYQVDSEAQRDGLLAYLSDAFVPAVNRLGAKPVGVFLPAEDLSPVYVLIPHASLDGLAALTERLLSDDTYMAAGAEFLNAPATSPGYARMESTILHAFKGMPALARPTDAPRRIFQLRIYESPSVVTGQKKIEMFNDAGEIAVFAKVGLKAVFYGEAIFGASMPNLTYMLSFDSMEEKDAAWKRFGGSPEWQKLKAMPEYADARILSNITNLFLKPAACSQL